VAKKAKIMFWNYPNNPTAGVCDLAYLEKSCAFAASTTFSLCMICLFGMTFDGYKAHSFLKYPAPKT